MYENLNERMVNDDPKTGPEFALNAFYAKDGMAWVRGVGENGEDLTLNDVVRTGLEYDVRFDDLTDDEIEEEMYDDLQYGLKDPAGIMAMMYQVVWVAAELRARLEEWESGERKRPEDDMNGWIPVSARKPEPECEVQVICRRSWEKAGKVKHTFFVASAMYENGKINTGDSECCWNEDCEFDYDEETDEYIIPEGWWECQHFGEESFAVDCEVLYWQPKTKIPAKVRKEG